jgi:predicted house-cleaning noncanonical NTP pyrophosphatase (MazG superfamily)
MNKKFHNPYDNKSYEKLVRDRIPEIIKKYGKVAVIKKITSDKEYYSKLLEKLQEEIKEFTETPNEEEAADILEVFHAILKFKKINFELVKEARLKKGFLRGGFEKRLVLKQISRLK